MQLYFITGNKGKLEEVKALFPNIKQLDIDLPEIQDIDPHNIIKAKLKKAFDHYDGEFIVEDTSLCLDCLNGLPGPFIKWFLKSIGDKGLFEMADKLGNVKAEAKAVFGYAKSREEIHFFEGTIKGVIVAPRGKNGFGWDSVFQPEGYSKTFGEMYREEKNKISHRFLALQKLKTAFPDLS